MYDRELITSIKQIGQLRNKPEYYQTLVDLFADEVSRSFAGLSAEVAKNPSTPEGVEDCWRILHKLKGSAGSIGATAVASSCHQLMSRWRGQEHSTQVANDAADITKLHQDCRQAIADMRSF